MNKVKQGTINLDMTLHTLRRRGMEGVANLLQCIIDNQYHGMQHEVTVFSIEGVEYVKWREDKRIDGTSHSEKEHPNVHDEYHGIRA